MKTQLRTFASVALTVGAVGFLAISLRRSELGLDDFAVIFDPAGVVVVAAFVLAVVIAGGLWARLLATLIDVEFSTEDAVWAHVQSWLLKYVPGQVGSVAGKVVWADDRSLSKRAVAVSFVYETLLYLLASLVVSLPVVFLLVPDSRSRFGVAIVALVVVQSALLFGPKIFGRLVAKRTGHEDLVLEAPQILRFELGYLVPRFVNAAGFVLIAAIVGDVGGVENAVAFGAVFVLAGVLGTLAFMVPSGLGVREAIIVALLTSRLGAGEALTLATAARVYATIADVVLAAALVAVGRGRQRRIATKPAFPIPTETST